MNVLGAGSMFLWVFAQTLYGSCSETGCTILDGGIVLEQGRAVAGTDGAYSYTATDRLGHKATETQAKS